MGKVLILFVLMAAACAASLEKPDAADDFAISLTRASFESRPVIVVTMTNRSHTNLCVRAELLKNPYTYSMDLRLRYSNGSEIRREDPGFLPPPAMEPIAVAPGASLQARYFIDARFKLRRSGAQLPKDLSAKAAFRYDLCDATHSRRAVSAWQRI